MKALTSIAAILAMSGSAVAQWSDDFNRANGPIGGNWTAVTGTWAILNNQGTHTSTTASTILQHNLASAPYAVTATTLEAFSNAGTTSYLTGVLIGLGGTDTIMVKLQDQSTAAAFGYIGVYHKTSATGWGVWTGTGAGFTALTAPVTSCQLKVYFTNGGDTLVAELDTDFNGTPDQTYTKTGVLTIAPNLGTGYGITGWGNVGTYGLFDNWTVGGGGPADACANANLLLGVQTGDTTTATNDGTSTCDATGSDVWYRSTAGPTGGQLSLNTCGSAIDTVLSVYTGTCGALTEIACNDDATGTPCVAPASALTLMLAPSQAITIRLSDKGVGGAYTLHSAYTAVPANDTCASAVALPYGVISGNTVLATNDGTSSCDPTGNDVWYGYTANAIGGQLKLETCGSAADTVLSVYDACGGNLVACDDNSAACGGGAAAVTLTLTPNQAYVVRVSDKGVGGAYTLTTTYLPIPPCNGTTLATIYTAGNGGSLGGQVFFDLNVTRASGIDVSQIDINAGEAVGTVFGLSVYTMPTTHVGSETIPGNWTLVSSGGGVLNGINVASVADVTPFHLAQGSYGVALVLNSVAGFDYTNGNGTNQVYANADVTMTCGAALNVPWTGTPFTPRVFNGAIRYDCTPPGPTSYCTVGTTTNGCLPTIAGTNNPNVAQSNTCVITVSNVEGQQSGIIFYGVSGTLSTPWCSTGGNSFLCVKTPLWRTNVQNAGGTFGQCDGQLVLDWSAYQSATPGAYGQPWSAGAKAHVQGWFRDPPACKTTFLSEALELTYQP